MTAPLHPRLVAAVRWDYEVGLVSCAEVVRKYRLVMGESAARRIMSREVQPEVAPVRHALAWAKTSWRRIR